MVRSVLLKLRAQKKIAGEGQGSNRAARVDLNDRSKTCTLIMQPVFTFASVVRCRAPQLNIISSSRKNAQMIVMSCPPYLLPMLLFASS